MTTTEQAPAEAEVSEQDATPAKGAKGVEDYTKYQTKEPTNLHEHYWAWIKDKTGIELDVTDAVAVKIVQIAVSAYQKYQASPENKQRREDEKDQREAEAANKKAAREAEKAKKAAEAAEAAEAKKAEAAAAGEGNEAAKRQAPPKKGRATGASKAAAGEAPF